MLDQETETVALVPKPERRVRDRRDVQYDDLGFAERRGLTRRACDRSLRAGSEIEVYHSPVYVQVVPIRIAAEETLTVGELRDGRVVKFDMDGDGYVIGVEIV